jgi:signal transduction histidine kinase
MPADCTCVRTDRYPEVQHQIPRNPPILIFAIADDVQALSHELHSSKFVYLGAVRGIRSWCKEFGERHGMEIEMKTEVASAIPSEIGVTLFRILQEALHNAVMPSGVKRIELRLWEQLDEIHRCQDARLCSCFLRARLREC